MVQYGTLYSATLIHSATACVALCIGSSTRHREGGKISDGVAFPFATLAEHVQGLRCSAEHVEQSPWFEVERIPVALAQREAENHLLGCSSWET